MSEDRHEKQNTIRRRDRDAILLSLRAGVVPQRGFQHIQVGRIDEVKALLEDIERIRDGGSAFRFVIGEFGSGKTFFLFLIRSIALQRGLVCAHADLNPARRLYASGGQAQALYKELMANLATRSRTSGATVSVVEKFIALAKNEAKAQERTLPDVISERLERLAEGVGGFDFRDVILAYARGHVEGDDRLKSDANRWLRGEITTRPEARKVLGVGTIVNDTNVWDQLKLFARFTRLAGFGGLLICLDEMVNLYKMANGQARRSNYEQILYLLNDSLQGVSEGIGFLLGGTPEFLMDPRRGLDSYEALRTRVERNPFTTRGLKDYTGPVIELANLTPEELYQLLRNLRHVYAAGDPERYLVPDKALEAFMNHCQKRIGAAYFRTPRDTIRAFLNFLAVLDQNPEEVSWEKELGAVEVAAEANPDLEPLPEHVDLRADEPGQRAPDDEDREDNLAEFRL